MGAAEVVRTYLEMADRRWFRPALLADPALRVERVTDCPPSFFRYLYTEVGREYGWGDRLSWDDEAIRRHLEEPAVSLWVLWRNGGPAGYFELRAEPDGNVELAYFGLLPEYVGQGLGKHLLSVAVERAWEQGARRVWLHTCTLDHPSAMQNYIRRGFTPFREERLPRAEPPGAEVPPGT
jgi:GNAT superfamily N-acetyltransferase